MSEAFPTAAESQSAEFGARDDAITDAGQDNQHQNQSSAHAGLGLDPRRSPSTYSAVFSSSSLSSPAHSPSPSPSDRLSRLVPPTVLPLPLAPSPPSPLPERGRAARPRNSDLAALHSLSLSLPGPVPVPKPHSDIAPPCPLDAVSTTATASTTRSNSLSDFDSGATPSSPTTPSSTSFPSTAGPQNISQNGRIVLLPHDSQPGSNIILPSEVRANPKSNSLMPCRVKQQFNLHHSPALKTLARDESVVEKQTHQTVLLLLDDPNATKPVIETFMQHGYPIKVDKGGLSEDELVCKVRNVYVIIIQAATHLTARVISAAQNLVAIGCFGVSTAQIDVAHATARGIAIFNSPSASSRSVAELVIGQAITLSRRLSQRSTEVEKGQWRMWEDTADCEERHEMENAFKETESCEVGGKVLGILGGSGDAHETATLARAMGMEALVWQEPSEWTEYRDVPSQNDKTTGPRNGKATVREVLEQSDFVCVLGFEDFEMEERVAISKRELSRLKKGAYFINNASALVVDLAALAEALKSGAISGAAMDIILSPELLMTSILHQADEYPERKAMVAAKVKRISAVIQQLRQMDNVLLTPKIGDSTVQAQIRISKEVSKSIIQHLADGSTVGAVNLPQVMIKSGGEDGYMRLLLIHRNIPGVLRKINRILGDYNVEKQVSDSRSGIAYLMAELSSLEGPEAQAVVFALQGLEEAIRVRVISI